MSSPVAPNQRMPYFVSMIPALKLLPISPSSPFDEAAVASGISVLHARGFHILSSTERRDVSPAYLNGSDEQRLLELQGAINNKSSDVLWFARGGYGLTRILSSLQLPAGKIPFVAGFSDATALHFHLWRDRRAKGIYAPTLAKLDLEPKESLDVLCQILQGHARQIKWPLLRKLYWPAQDETVEGPLLSANLCVLTHLIGTGSMPSLGDSILVLEEVGERPYRIDRMITQLWHSGSLRGVKAIILGHFTGCDEPGNKEMTAESVMLERCKTFGIPLCAGLPVGHESPNWAIPFGVQAQLRGTEHVELRILEELA